MESSAKPKIKDARKLFLKKGTCSHTMFYILNREFGHFYEKQEKATDVLAGGIMQQGYQCGFLWGAIMAVGAEAFRRNDDVNTAASKAITTAKMLMESFEKTAHSVDCLEITDIDWTKKFGLLKSFISGQFLSCLSLSKKWAPEAIYTAKQGLSLNQDDVLEHTMNCASEVAKKMGASDEEMLMVAGFAGGMGLSGNACGALSAAVWMKSMAWAKENPEKSSFPNPYATETLEAFQKETEYEMLCSDITGLSFNTVSDHSEYIKTGGCAKLIEVLAQSS